MVEQMVTGREPVLQPHLFNLPYPHRAEEKIRQAEVLQADPPTQEIHLLVEK